jgi:hypothetical protein
MPTQARLPSLSGRVSAVEGLGSRASAATNSPRQPKRSATEQPAPDLRREKFLDWGQGNQLFEVAF